MLRLLIDQDLDQVILRGLLLRVPNLDVILEVELHRKLNQSRVVTRRNNSTEVAWVTSNLARVGIDGGLSYGAKVTYRVGKVYVIEQIEKLGTQFDVL